MLSDASAADNFWKPCDKRRNCAKQAISPFATMFSTLFKKLNSHLLRYITFLPKCSQSHLLQICYMWERVKSFFSLSITIYICFSLYNLFHFVPNLIVVKFVNCAETNNETSYIYTFQWWILFNILRKRFCKRNLSHKIKPCPSFNKSAADDFDNI